MGEQKTGVISFQSVGLPANKTHSYLKETCLSACFETVQRHYGAVTKVALSKIL